MNIIYLDTETTGLNQSTSDVLEISIIDDNGAILLDTLCSPTKNTTWHEAQCIHGITPEVCAGKPTLVQLIPRILEIFAAADEIIIYNAAYDYPFLINAAQGDCEAYDKLRSYDLKCKCAMLEYARHIGEWNDYRNDYRWHKLTAAAAHVGHKWEGQAHRALADTQATRSVWHWLQTNKEARS